jgi:ankyrin repeat protein
MQSRLSAARRQLLLGLALLLGGLFTVAVYLCAPSVRLLIHHRQLHEISAARWVDAHRYDQEWFDAARAGRVDILQALYVAHYPLDRQTSAGYTAVILAAYDSKPDALAYLLGIGADPCRGDRHGNTALMGALYKGDLAVARRLLATPCAIDQANNAGETALSFAALFGRLEILPELVAHGADPNHVDARGNTPLSVVLKQGNADSANALRRVGATY